MKYCLRYIILYICTVLLLSGCTEENDKPKWNGVHNRTVLVYMAAENDLFTGGYASNDIAEMEEGAKKLPDDVNLLLFQDSPNANSVLYKIDRTGRKVVKDYSTDLVSTDVNVLRRIVGDVESIYSAKEYGILMWSHATGWQPAELKSRSKVTRSFGVDNNPGSLSSQMDIRKMAESLRSFPKFRYIMFDACFMQCIEVAYDLKDVTDYIIAAPCEIPGPGANYDKLVPAMFTDNPAEDLVNNYYQPYLEDNNKNPSSEYGAVMAALDCSEIDNFATVTRKVLPEYQDSFLFDTTPLQMYLAYNSRVSNSISPYYDIKGEMMQLLSPEDYLTWEAALNKLIVAKGTTLSFFSEYHHPNVTVDQSKFSGLAGYIPHFYPNSEKWDNLFRQTTWYEAAGWKEKGW